MIPLERHQAVLDILKGFHGADPLKQLFWSELNYSRINTPLSRRGWSSATADVLADDPTLFAAGGDEFHIIHSRLATDRLLMGQERPVVSQLLKEHPYALFVFSNRKLNRWHFLNVKYDDEITKRRVFRRITVGPEERLRTASERIAMLDLESVSPDLFGLSPLAIQKRHDEAFDVEPVTKEFFHEYAHIFEQVEGQIQGIKGAESKRLFTQRLFNRLMFVAYIQKKGWLKFDGNTDYLNSLWRDFLRRKKSGANFYSDRLKLLFFAGLNTPNEVNVIGINRGGFLKDLIGKVPYLNGGLFDEDEDDRDANIVIPDISIDSILTKLFSRFNFTVTESTPLDVEVAVDPEMLGRIFEELVTGRHETGSYYTPKPVVSFMCKEALKGYLRTSVSNEAESAVDKFVDEHDPSEIGNAEAVLEALRTIKVCDPACGSGAYPLGMLHELLDLRACLFATHSLDPISTYQRKLQIIQNNLYGVDIDPFAVNIARLRLWLSLAVDFEGDDPPPLPNLDFKVEVGDSLTAPDPTGGLEQGFRKALIGEFLRKRAEYLMAHGSHKVTLKREIGALKETITGWAHGNGTIGGFDWAVEFAEVFLERGFDVTLANPPYVRADAKFKHLDHKNERLEAISEWKDYRAGLLGSEIYSTLYEKWDLYVPFLERGYQLLQPGGRLVFIISDAYNAAKYAQKSHEFFIENSQIERVDFCTEIPLFDAGVSNTIVHFAKAQPIASSQPVRVRRWGESRDEFGQNVQFLPSGPQVEVGASLFRPSSQQEHQHFHKTVALGEICYVSYGLRANSDDRFWPGEFTTDDCLSDRKDRIHSRPFVRGKDLVTWVARSVAYLEWGTDRAPRKFSRPTFPELHLAKEKLIAVRTPGVSPKVIYDDAGLHFDASSVGFIRWHCLSGVRNKSIRKTARYRDEAHRGRENLGLAREELETVSQGFELKYILAIMNSMFARDWLAARRRSRIHVYPDDWKQLPVKVIPLEKQMKFVNLVDLILAEFETSALSPQTPTAEKITAFEQEINDQVSALYGI